MRIIIIGGGAAAAAAAVRIRELDKSSSITIFSAEAYLPYRRPMLLQQLHQELLPERFYIYSQDFYDRHHIEIKLNTPVTAIDWTEKRIRLPDQSCESYDKLLLAVGSHVRPFREIGTPGNNVISLHDLRDIEIIKTEIKQAASCIIAGGGVLALELAGKLLEHNIKVTILEGSPQLLHGVTDHQCASFISEKILQDPRLEVYCNTRVDSIESTQQQATCYLSGAAGNVLSADMAVNACGVLPANIEWQPLIKSQPLQVNEYMQINGFDDLFAAGDCAYFPGIRSGSYFNACQMGRVAGSNIVQKTEKITISPPEFRTKFMNTKVYSAGDTLSSVLTVSLVQKQDSLRKLYYKNHKLAGCTLINDLSDADELYELIKKNQF